MPMSKLCTKNLALKFLTESTGEKIDQYLAKIWIKYDSLLFFGPPCRVVMKIDNIRGSD